MNAVSCLFKIWLYWPVTAWQIVVVMTKRHHPEICYYLLILEAVNSARLSNKVALEGLKSKLDNINSNTVYLDDRQKVLEGENSVMQ